MGYKILLLEDDRLFAESLKDFLEEEGFIVDIALDPKSALSMVFENRYHLYLLDINLPFEDGLSFLSSLREAKDLTPAIFITSRDDKESLIEGFKIGGDDFLRKPVDLDELSLRVKALLNRTAPIEPIEFGEFRIDPALKRVYKKEEEIILPNKVFDLLMILIREDGRYLSAKEIEERLWNVAEDSSYGALRVYINRLRKIFGDRIESIRGVGYRFKPIEN
ncbi:MAG: response regulator transcription factor [Epsilonproteobacteria bacterium]|nr:response regulator transcription factor [Campylobacterota bacterium]